MTAARIARDAAVLLAAATAVAGARDRSWIHWMTGGWMAIALLCESIAMAWASVANRSHHMPRGREHDKGSLTDVGSVGYFERIIDGKPFNYIFLRSLQSRATQIHHADHQIQSTAPQWSLAVWIAAQIGIVSISIYCRAISRQISGIHQASLFHLILISLSFALISLVPLFILFDLCLRICSH